MSSADDAERGPATASPVEFAIDFERAGAGAPIFSTPILMAMRMGDLGFPIDPLRLAPLFLPLPALLVGPSRVGGFRRTRSLREDVTDAFVTVAVALLVALAVSSLFGCAGSETPLRNALGKVTMRAAPGGIGAAGAGLIP